MHCQGWGITLQSIEIKTIITIFNNFYRDICIIWDVEMECLQAVIGQYKKEFSGRDQQETRLSSRIHLINK